MVPAACRAARRSAADRQRQAGSQGAAGDRRHRTTSARARPERPGKSPLRALCRDPWLSTGRHRGQLLCSGRALAFSHPPRQPDPRRPRGGVAIRTLFETPTVAGLAERLDADTNQNPLDVILPLRPRGSLPPVFCAHPAGGLSWCYSGLLQHIRADYPIYGLQARGFKQSDLLPQTLEEMCSDYLDQIRIIQPSGPYRLLGWSFGGFVAFAIANRLQLRGEQVALLALLDSYPNDQGTPPHIPDEQEIIRTALEALGYDPANLGEAPLRLSECQRTPPTQR